MLGMIDLGVFKGFVNKELDDEEIIKTIKNYNKNPKLIFINLENSFMTA